MAELSRFPTLEEQMIRNKLNGKNEYKKINKNR